MSTELCERCGIAAATVTLATDGAHALGAPPVHGPTPRYCRPCARELGVTIPDSLPRDVAELDDLSPPTWSDIERVLAGCESALRHDPSMREHVLKIACNVSRSLQRDATPMPPSVVAALERLGVGPK